MSRLLLAVAAVLVLAGCGRGATVSTVGTTATRPTAEPAQPRVFTATRADIRFARTLFSDERIDRQAAQLASRKAASTGLQRLAARRYDALFGNLRALRSFILQAHSVVPPEPLANGSYLTSLIDVAGSAFDSTYISQTETRDATELQLARAEERHGRATAAKAIADSTARALASQVAALRGSS